MKLFIPFYLLILGIGLIVLSYLPVSFSSFSFVMGIAVFLLGIIVLAIFLKKKGIKKYCKSIQDTFHLRRVLKQVKGSSSKDDKSDRIQQLYNSALNYTYIDYDNERMRVWICIPENFQARKILDDNLEMINEEIASYTDEYVLSAPIRKNKYYVIEGVKK